MKNEAAQSLGRRGGQKTAERGRDYYRSIGKQGAVARWGYKHTCYRCGEVFRIHHHIETDRPSCTPCWKYITSAGSAAEYRERSGS